MRDFSKKTLRALAARGMRVIGITYLPDPTSEMPMANGETGYLVDDRGTQRIMRFSEVLAAAAEEVK